MKIDETLPQWQSDLPNGTMHTLSKNYTYESSKKLVEPGSILIVDDSLRIITSLNYIFKNLGCNTLLSFDGYTAIDHLIHQPVDLIVLDMRMPLMDGEETLRKAQDVFKEKSGFIPGLANKKIPFVVYTGSEDSGIEKSEFDNFKLMDVWHKPMSFSSLSSRVNKIIDTIS